MKRKLLFAMLCIVSALGLNAQTWTAPVLEPSELVSGGTYYIKNVGVGQFLTGANSWGTQISLTTSGNGLKVRLDEVTDVDVDGVKLSGWEIVNLTNSNKLFFRDSEAAGFVDRGSQKRGFVWNITKVGSYYRLQTAVGDKAYPNAATQYAGADEAGKPVEFNRAEDAENIDWAFCDAILFDARTSLYELLLKAEAEGVNTDDAGAVYNNASATVEDINAATTALDKAIFDHSVAIASEDNPQDLTAYFVVNADFSTKNGDGWTRTGSWGNQQFGTGAMESWNNNNVSVLQNLEGLPNGKYRVACDMISGNDTKTAYVYAKGMTEVIGETVSAKSSAGNYNTMSNEVAGNTVSAYPVLVDKHTMTIGFKDPSGWVVVDNFKIIYYGPDLTAFKEALQSMIDDIADLKGTTTTAAYNAAKSYADGIDMDALTTEEAISTASSELASLVDAAKALQPSYSRYATIRDAALAISSNVVLPDVESATTTDAIDAAIPTLRENFLTELPNVTIPADPGFIDVTAVMVDNAGVHTNTDYWTAVENGSARTGNSWAVCNYGECEFYKQNFKFYQTLALTPGTWEFGVTGFHRAGNHNTYFYAGDDKILIPGVESSVVNTMAAAKDYFDGGNGKVALKFLIETAGNVEIGIDNKDTETDKWTIFRDFTLKYYGAPDYTIYDQQWSDAVTAANETLDAQAYKYVSGSERTAVTTAIADAPDGSSKANYLEKIQTLEAATATFKAAASSYNAWVLAKTETKELWGSALGVEDPTTAAEAVTAVQNLNIAQYNKVATEYTFSATGLIGDFGSWTGTATVNGEPATPNYLSNEHWSGTTHAYYEQAAAGWGSDAWTIKYEKTCTLPAGSYVIKVAARSSVDVTSSVSCSATATTISLPNVGNSGRGISKSGAASWSDGDAFIASTANVENAGAGWQWRFLPFTLDEQTEVTMTFYAETNKKYNWMSIADGELLSTTKLAQDVAYDENAANTIENTIIADVTMARTIKSGYNTVVVPFDLTANQVTEVFGAGTKVYNFSEESDDAEAVKITFQSGDGSITANVPVLVKATNASDNLTFKGVQVKAPAADVKVAGNFIDFVGTYAPVDVAEGDYFVGNGALYRSEGNTSMNAFRAFLKVKSAEVKAELFIDGVATAIESINGNVAQPAGAIYNLAGQRVQKAQRGLYIVNGKKVVVK